MNFGLGFRTAKEMFFDRAKIKNQVDKTTRKALSKFGSFVRQTSQQSIRRGRGTSKPGKPPFSHTGLLKKFIYFGFDPHRTSVVIGPVVISGKSGKALQALESGGTITLPDGRQAKVEPRPFMGPAFQAELTKVASIWRDAVR